MAGEFIGSISKHRGARYRQDHSDRPVAFVIKISEPISVHTRQAGAAGDPPRLRLQAAILADRTAGRPPVCLDRLASFLLYF